MKSVIAWKFLLVGRSRKPGFCQRDGGEREVSFYVYGTSLTDAPHDCHRRANEFH